MIGIIIGVVIVAGLVFAMGKMSDMGVDANENFCDGDCGSCADNLDSESCGHRDEKTKKQ